MTSSAPPTARSRDEILACLQNTPLRIGQIDVNGKCNAKCWYCPVRYEGNPAEFAVQMPLEMLDEILGKLRSSPLIPADFRFLYTCHYNEVLLYRHFAELPGVFRKHGFATMILSNGTPLTPDKTDIILANQDVIWGLALNIPALEEGDWARKTGFPASMHRKLLRNLDYLHEHRGATIQVNCATNAASVLGEGMSNTREEAEAIAAAFRQRYPAFKVSLQTWLSDRAGKLGEHGAISLQQDARRAVIGCSHSANEGGRVFGWLHINARGELFLCCDDYEMRYRFGDLTRQDFAEAWLAQEHIDAIEASRKGICRHCPFRIEETD
ncbi:MAG: SPASM domain-containing protein [Azonexus sp.]|nr:SPASM domain-containing protein [Azonexus sp.]MCK6413523.1 SPASM domain-containing protein [Azonexus sp.]